MRIIGYTADADVYCDVCGPKEYPGCDTSDVLDREGNTVHPIFSTDEVPPYWCCTKCGELIDMDGELLRRKDLYLALWQQYCECDDIEIMRTLNDDMDDVENSIKELEAKLR